MNVQGQRLIIKMQQRLYLIEAYTHSIATDLEKPVSLVSLANRLQDLSTDVVFLAKRLAEISNTTQSTGGVEHEPR